MNDADERGFLELSRREALQMGGAVGAMALSSSGTVAAQQTSADGFQDAEFLIGAQSNRPEPGDDFFDNKRNYHYFYLGLGENSVQWSEIVDGDDGWADLGITLANFATADLPASPPTGSVFFDTSRGLPAWFDRDHYDFPSFVDNQDVLLSPQTVSNTTTETQVYSITFNPGSLIQGRIYQLDLMGTFSTANTSDQFTVIIDLGGTELATLTNEPDNASVAPWSMETTYTVRSHGTTGQIQPHSRGVFDSVTRDDHHGTATVDTTVAEDLTISISWDAADPDNSVTLGQAHLKQMA